MNGVGRPRLAAAWVVARADATATYGLRQSVLRPHQRIDEVGFPGDGSPGACHFAARIVPGLGGAAGGGLIGVASGGLIGVVSVIPEAAPRQLAGPAAAGAWRLRGMAVHPSARGLGVGRDLLGAVVERMLGLPAPVLLWCTAREAAVGFYAKAGFEEAGGQFDVAGIGAHRLMWRTVAAGAPASQAAAGGIG